MMTPPQWRDWIQLPRLHYVLHLALISSYALARRYFTQHGHTEYSRIITTPEQLFAFEKQAGGMMAAVLAIQVLRKKNNASLASDLLLYGHAVAAALCYYIDKRVCVLYGVGYCLLFLLFPPPMHRGATQVKLVTPAGLQDLLKKQEASLLVMMFAPWSQASASFDTTFAGLSLKYQGHPGLRFIKLDVSRWPNAAEEHKVSLISVNCELPTLVMFERGRESRRLTLPPGSVLRGGLAAGDVETHFKLQRFPAQPARPAQQ